MPTHRISSTFGLSSSQKQAAEKPISITPESITDAKSLIQLQQPVEHPLDTAQKIQSLYPRIPGFCMIFQNAGVMIQRASSAVQAMSQQVQERAAQIFR